VNPSISSGWSGRNAAVAPAEPPAIGAKVRNGTVWSLVGYGGSQALRFGGNLALTHLLVPHAFGVMALVNALLAGLQLFSDVGIGPSIIQNRRGGDAAFLDTAWSVQVVRGLLLWVASCVAAAPFAHFYGEPALLWIVPVTGATAAIAGFNSTRIFTAYRNVELARLCVLELGSQLAGIAVMIGWGLVHPSIAALAAGAIAGAVARLALSHTILPGSANRLRWDPKAIGPMLRFGRWIFLSTMLTFLVSQSDRLVFGKLVSMEMLGVYAIGAGIALIPSIALSRMASSVYFPVYAGVHNSGRDLAEAFASVRRPALLLAGWSIAGLAGGGDAAVRLLYEQEWSDAGWVVQLLALGSWFNVLDSTNGAALLARGQAKWLAAGNAGKLLGMVAAIPAGFALGGFAGAVAGLALSDVFRWAVSSFALSRVGLRSWPQDLRYTLAIAVSGGIGWQAALLAQRAGWSRVGVALAVFVVVTLAWAPAAARLARRRAVAVVSAAT
jgi:O-antigen/teichoic acid export membrane protein